MRRALAIVAFTLAAPIAALGAEPVAFIADVRGSAMIEGNGKLTFLAELPPGTRVLLGTNASAVVVFAASGTEFTLRGPGEFRLEATEAKADRGSPVTRRAVASVSSMSVINRLSQTATASVRMRGVQADSKAPEADAEQLSPQVMERIERSRAAAKTFPDRVMHAILLQEVGALKQARAAWRDLARERPDLPELAALARR